MKRPILVSSGLGVLFLAVLSGCDQATLMKKMTPQEDEAITRRYVDDLRQNRFDQIEQDLNPGLKDSNMHGTLASIAAMFPAQEPVSTKVVGFRSFLGNDRRTEITLEYEFPQKWLLAEVVTQQSGGVRTIVGFHVTPIADSLENLNRFTLAGKSTSQYAILSLAVLAPLFSLYVFVVCIKTTMGKKKWLWLIFILLGIGKFIVNWTTGQVFLTPLAIQLPAAGANAQLYGPWLVYVSMPLGAIIFLIMRKSLAGSVRRTQDSPLATPPGVMAGEKSPLHSQPDRECKRLFSSATGSSLMHGVKFKCD
jgi:hypothetical protein